MLLLICISWIHVAPPPYPCPHFPLRGVCIVCVRRYIFGPQPFRFFGLFAQFMRNSRKSMREGEREREGRRGEGEESTRPLAVHSVRWLAKKLCIFFEFLSQKACVLVSVSVSLSVSVRILATVATTKTMSMYPYVYTHTFLHTYAHSHTCTHTLTHSYTCNDTS